MNVKYYLILISLLFGTINQYAQEVSFPKNDLNIDLLSVNYSRIFWNSHEWAIGAEIGIGIWGFKYAFMPIQIYNTDQGITTEETRFIGDLLKLKPFVRFYYYKSNFIDLGYHLSSVLTIPIFMDNNGLKGPNYATGLDFSVAFGWNKFKFGTGLQANYLGYFNKKIGGIKPDGQFVLLWTPIQFIIIF